MAVSVDVTQKRVDVIVIGAGPAGMMAAASAARRGRRVVLLEKNPVLGKKLSTTGGGRCNVTNNRLNPRALATAYGPAQKFLHSLFARYGVRETKEYFLQFGVDLIEENEGRLFPSTQKAATIVSVLDKDCRESGVEVCCNVTVQGIVKEGAQFIVHTTRGIYYSESCVVATGGTARPDTGSTGEGFIWLKELGHTIMPSIKTLVPIMSSDSWVTPLAGLTLSDVKLVLRLDDKRIVRIAGKVLFTHVGLSGPTIINLSRKIGELLPAGKVTVGIQLFPDANDVQVRSQLQDCLTRHSNQKIQNALKHLVPEALVIPILTLGRIAYDAPAHSVRKDERQRLCALLCELPVVISGLLGPDKAIATGGGVELSEVDWRTMESKLVSGLFLVGDVLDVNRPSGGYSLQLCWSTGAVAGQWA